MDSEIVMVMTENDDDVRATSSSSAETLRTTSSTAQDVVLAAADGDVQIIHDSSLDDVIAMMGGPEPGEAEHEEEEEGMEADDDDQADAPIEMMNSLDGTGQTYIPSGGAETFHAPSFGDETFEVQQGLLQQQQQQQQSDQQQHQQFAQYPGQYPAPIFPPTSFDVPDIRLSNSVTGGPGVVYQANTGGPGIATTVTRAMMGQDGTQKSPLRESGGSDSDDSVPLAQLAQRQASSFAAVHQPVQVAAPKKARSPKKGKKKKDPNEPQKPVSAYAMFFRDTQAAIKSQNPNATFGEVSKIVASMWDNLGVDCKNVYKKKTELAKKEYLKQLAVYRASLVSKQSPYDYHGDQSGSGMMVASPPGDVNKQLAQLHEMAQVASHLSSPTTLEGPMISHQQHHMSPPQGSPQQHMSPQQQMQHMSPPQGSPQQHMSPQQQMQHMSPPQGSPQQQQHMSPQQMQHMSPSAAQMMGMSGQDGTQDQSSPHQQMIQPGMDPNGYPSGVPSPHQDQNGYCLRKGCQNTPLDGPNYENAYCSNECVVAHCRDVFQNWVANRQTSYASVK